MTKEKAVTKKPEETPAPVVGFKGFDKDLKCRGFQFEIGKEYKHEGAVKLCGSGFHFVEYPLDAFNFYAPGLSRYAEVEPVGLSDETESGDSKRVAAGLVIKAELSFSALVEAAVKFTFGRAKMGKGAHASKDQGAASATGDQGAASATGSRGAASATGYQGAAVSLGFEGRAKGAVGCWLTVAEWKRDEQYLWQRIDVQTVRVDGVTIKADTFYMLKAGQFVEVAA